MFIVAKRSPVAFQRTDLGALIHWFQVRNGVITGCTLNNTCIKTAASAYERHLNVKVVAEPCVASSKKRGRWRLPN
ncbi:isochorismatase family protein [Levilactobacillus bambusae]|uniref:Isochorismatase-like domain-containing protein n=1 Tax=Levilactobacillus bambusae TaxID=2024736 RepID=A0A2V1N174_9LACO|nr:isochorismatase family protein [Levilactobacillus bambusae]PWG01041.1 hypothetical protein DCM90_02375 [Levilactobacillus bambusae]